MQENTSLVRRRSRRKERPRRSPKEEEGEGEGIGRNSASLEESFSGSFAAPRNDKFFASKFGEGEEGEGGSSSASSFLVVGFNQRIFHFIRRLNVSKIDGPMMINHGRWWRHDEEKSDPAAFIHEDDFHAKEIREITRDEHFSAQNFSFFLLTSFLRVDSIFKHKLYIVDYRSLNFITL